MNHIKLFFQLIILFIFTGLTFATEPVYTFIDSSYTGFAIKDPSNLSNSIKKSFDIDLNTPTTVIADFDGNDLKDYAFILEDTKNQEQVFVVFLQTVENEFKAFELERNTYVFDYIELVLPGTLVEPTQAFEIGKRAHTLKHAGINAINYGKSSAVFYWASSKFESIWTSD